MNIYQVRRNGHLVFESIYETEAEAKYEHELYVLDELHDTLTQEKNGVEYRRYPPPSQE